MSAKHSPVPALRRSAAALRTRLHGERGSGLVSSMVLLVIVGLIGATAAGTMAVTLGSQRDTVQRTYVGEGLSGQSENERLRMLDGGAASEKVTLSQELGESEESRTARYSVTYPDTFVGFDDAGEPVWINKEGAQDHHFAQLVVGDDFACGLEADEHHVWCWGSNAYGQLGDGTRREASEPVRVVDEDDVPVTMDRLIEPSGYGICGVRKNGDNYRDLLCWGKNTEGRFKKTDSAGKPEIIPFPVVVDTRSQQFPTAAIADHYALGPNTLCFTRWTGGSADNFATGRQLMCLGRMAISSTSEGDFRAVKQILVDTHTGMIVNDRGEVYTWTDSGLGALGHDPAEALSGKRSQRPGLPYEGSGQRSTIPGQRVPTLLAFPSQKSADDKVVRLALTLDTPEEEGTTAYAFTASNQAWVWGDNSHGEAGGKSTTGGGRFVETPFVLVEKSTAAEVGPTRAVLHLAGAGTKVVGKSIPSYSAGTSSSTVVLSRSAGADGSACVTTAGVVRCGGDNTKGQLGDAAGTATGMREIPALRDLEVHLGADFGCALDTNGVASCWGYSELGQTGRGEVGQALPVKTIATRDVPVGTLTRVVDGSAVGADTIVTGGTK